MKIIIKEDETDLFGFDMEVKSKEDITDKEVLNILSESLVYSAIRCGISKRHFIKLMKMYYKEINYVLKTLEEVNEKI